MRIEKDALGELPVPEEAYYGIQTVRCAQNYDVTDHTFNELPHVIRAVAEVKKAAALANKEIKALEARKADAIAQACDEIIAGKLSDQFPVNIWRSHGTGVNMNVNEVTSLNGIVDGHAADACSQKTHTDNAVLKGYEFNIAAVSLYVWTYFFNGLLDFIYLSLHPIPSFSNG